MTKHNQSSIIKNCISNGQLMNEDQITNNRRFNFTDFYYVLRRSIKSYIIREWHLQLLKAFCLFCGVFMCIALYPNDIGLDPSCSIDLQGKINISDITDQIYDAINGKRSKGEMNVSYLIVLFLGFGLVYIECIAFVFPDEIKVSLKFTNHFY